MSQSRALADARGEWTQDMNCAETTWIDTGRMKRVVRATKSLDGKLRVRAQRYLTAHSQWNSRVPFCGL